MIDDESLVYHKKVYDHFAKEMFSHKDYNYEYNEKNSKVITDLIYYFNGNEGNLDLNKGVGIIGNPGSGKTIMMEIFIDYLKKVSNPNPNLYRSFSIEEMKEYYRINHNMNYFQHNKIAERMSRPFNLCVNEAFVPYDEKIYGTNVNEIFNNFWMVRYELFQKYGKLTHFTSNSDASDLKNNLSDMLYDRIKEMVNLVVLDCESFRK